MIFSVLASGSTGNCTLLKSESGNFLIDAGTNLKNIENRLLEINLKMEDINYIFISHCHSDHISSIPQIIKKYHPTIFLTGNMHNDIKCLKQYDNIINYDNDLIIKNLKVNFIKTSHDALNSTGIIFTEINNLLII